MSASPALHYVNYALAHSALSLARVRGSGVTTCDEAYPAGQIKRVFKKAGLTVTAISVMTRAEFGEKSSYYIPPTFLYKQRKGVTPHICQIVALSKFTEYTFSDWMSLLGFDLRLIPALQMRLHSEQTTIITPVITGTECEQHYPFNNTDGEHRTRRYLYAKVGRQDAKAHPPLAAGSIVRADRSFVPRVSNASSPSRHLWLVSHPNGLSCCELQRFAEDQVLLMSNRASLSKWPLRLSSEAQILGLIDLQFQPGDGARCTAFQITDKTDVVRRIPCNSPVGNVSRLLRVARSRAGLTFRSAHQLTNRISNLLGNESYSISLGLLSDYEAMNKLPRHIAKVLSLCIIYGVDLRELMHAANVCID